ncbi:BspA family leucine-rich repeat surface protein [Corynebacterium variabile]|uniref:BspA family leucine-rich repeat surface protein n=1 Tax=Corynebacterium variabile TaxID=1727 RepID=UPI003FD25691
MSITINGSGVDSVHIDGETIGSIWVDGAQVWSSAPKREVVKINNAHGYLSGPGGDLGAAIKAHGLDYKTMTELPFDLDTSGVTDMMNMFYGCAALKTIPEMDTSGVTDMRDMFKRCSSLESVPEMDTGNVYHAMSMFEGCSSLETIPALDTHSLQVANSMFEGCSSLETIPALDTSKVESLARMFYGCSSLTAVGTIDGRSTPDRDGKTGSLAYMFKNTPKLKNSKAKVLVSGTVTNASYAVSGSGLTTAVFVRG